MNRLKLLPIRCKLLFMILGLSGFLVVGGYSMAIIEKYYSTRSFLVRNTSTLASTLGANSTAAIIFRDAATAEEILSALSGEATISNAFILLDSGEIFAKYSRTSLTPLETLNLLRLAQGQDAGRPDQHLKHFDLAQPITLGTKRIGTIVLRTDLTPLYRSLKTFVLVSLGGLCVLFSIAYLLAYKLQELITSPIIHLAQKVNEVSQTKDYSIRATARSHDELGSLIDGFNGMLAQIQAQDEELKHAKETAELANQSKSQFLANMSQKLGF